MKNRILLSVGLLMGMFGAALHAAAEPMFDIINKTGKTIFITIRTGGNSVLVLQEVKPAVTIFGKTIISNHFSYDITTRSDVGLMVIVAGTREEAEKKLNAQNYWVYLFKVKDKKIYVTLHKDGVLNPQTGPSDGKTDKIEAGYLKEGMITQGDIQKIG